MIDSAQTHLPSLATILEPKLASPTVLLLPLKPLAKYALSPAPPLSFPGVFQACPLDRPQATGVKPSAAEPIPGLVTRQSLAALHIKIDE